MKRCVTHINPQKNMNLYLVQAACNTMNYCKMCHFSCRFPGKQTIEVINKLFPCEARPTERRSGISLGAAIDILLDSLNHAR
jgi:hypothetical protein